MKDDIIEAIVGGRDNVARARAAYLAICVELSDSVRQAYPAQWAKAVNALENNSKVVQVLFHHSPVPLGDSLRAKALAEGVTKPAGREDIW